MSGCRGVVAHRPENMGRGPCCSKEAGLNRGPWSAKEDMLLTNYIQAHGEGQWRSLPNRAGLLRCGKSCRLRWLNYLRPGIKRGNITPDEEDLIIRLQSLLGNRWSLIAGRLPGRTDNEIKNHWNTHIVKRLKEKGIRPKQHKHISSSKKRTSRNRTELITIKKHSKRSDHPNDQIDKKHKNDSVDGDQVLYLPKPRRLSSAARFTTPSSADDSRGSVGSSTQQQQPRAEEVEVDDNKEADHQTFDVSDNIPWSSFDLGNEHSSDPHHHNHSLHQLVDYDLSLQDYTMLNEVYSDFLQLL